MPQYNKADIGRAATQYGFIRDTFEKVLRLKEILDYFNTREYLANHLILKGGTAINLTVFDLPRLSVDIDMDYTPNDSRDNMLVARERITGLIKEYMEREGYSLSPASRFSHSLDAFHYNYINAGGNKDIIKIELNYSLRAHIFLKSVFAYSHEHEKVLVNDRRYEIDIFGDCLYSYSDKTGRTRLFPLNRIILLYGIVVYLQNQQKISYNEFVRRIRILNNLIQNSADAISGRADRNRIPAILQQVDAVILTGQIDDTIDNSFSVHQLKEEAEKIEYLQKNPADQEKLYRLEDHPMLNGQIAILGLENLDLVDQFESLFTCEWDNIDIAMMSIGNYGQMERNKRTYQFASKGMQIAWDELFHRSANSGFENTRNILVTLLKKQKEFKDEDLQAMASDYIKECETKQVYPWRYYYIKYPSYRPGSYGKLFNDDPTNFPYNFDVMQTKSKPSQNTYLPYLKEADSVHLDRGWMGRLLKYGDQYVECDTTAYRLCNYADDTLIEEELIPQNENGDDVKDRVEVLKEYLKRKCSV